eukprot:g4678.t1
MASSAYLVELDERRRRLLAELIDHLGITSGSEEHEIALSFGLNSLSNHDHMDPEKKKVETTVCSFAEKMLMQGKTSDATRLLQLASSFSGTPVRVEGHRMTRGDVRRAAGQPPPEHPYAALALTLALSGSPTWTTTTGTNDDEAISSAAATSAAGGVGAIRRGSAKEQSDDGELAGLGGDSSRLWSTDNEDDEENDGKVGRDEEERGGGAEKGGRGPPGAPRPLPEDTDERDTHEWLRAFESDGERSPRTDDEGYATDGSEAVERRRGRWGDSEVEARPGAAPAPFALPSSSAANVAPSTGNATGRPVAVGQVAVRHKYGTTCIGADIHSLGGGGGRGRRRFHAGERDAVPAWTFLRPCQTLEACQTLGGGAAGRCRSIPEAEVVRAALHMLQGLSGDLFVRANDKVSPQDHTPHHQNQYHYDHPGPGIKNDRSGGRERPRRRSAPGSSGGGGGAESGRASALPGGREWFSLSASAARDLAVASLSPEALAGLLGELVGLGSVAEYLRAFVADAEASASVAAAGAARRGGAESDNCGDRASSGEEGGGGGGGGGGGCKHGHTTQAFVACVRHQLEAFEDAVARQDRGLYLRQTARGSGGGNHDDRGSSAGGIAAPRTVETLVGTLSLLRREAEALEVTKNLVEAGAGWWVGCPPGGPVGEGSQRWPGRRPADATAGRGSREGGLRERTGRLLAVLHEAVVSSALVGTGLPRQGGGGDGARAPRRHGWLLRIFCAVLAPYLRLLDSWITEGIIFDPHGELFLSQSGGGGSNVGAPVRGRNKSDPVVHVWDTGIVLHSKALPPFFAPLAPAVALAGQDISLMRRVRTLVSGSSSSSVSFGSGDAGFGRSSHRRGLDGTGPVMTSKSPESEAFSLADTLVESLRRLAVRVRAANRAGLARKLLEEGRGPDGIVDPSGAASVDSFQAVDPLDADVGEHDRARLDDDQHRKEGSEAFAANGISVREDVRAAISADVTETARATSEATAGDDSPGGLTMTGDEPAGRLTTEEALPLKPEGSNIDRGEDGGRGGGGGGSATRPETEAVEESSVGVERGGADGGSALVANATEEAQEDDHHLRELGFFGGTARMALEPDTMFRRALHPALAAPWLTPPPPSPPRPAPSSSPPTPASPAATDVPEQRTVPGFATGTIGGREGPARETEPARDSAVGISVDLGGADGGGDEGATAMEGDIATALPPTVVLETCLLGPLRQHCRLASSSCLGAFADELGIVGLAGVLREIYLSPGGAKSVTPLSRFRGVLFGLLGALPRRSLAGDGVGSKSAAAVLDGVVVRDVPSFLQDGPRLTALLQSSLAMSGLEVARGSAGGTNVGGGHAGGAGGDGDKDSGDWLRSPVVGGDRPLLEYFFVECIPETVREWRGGGAGGDADGKSVGGIASGLRSGTVAASAFPLAPEGRCVDLQVFSCLQLECRLPWPISVALPPRSLDKYSRVLGLLLKLEFTTHVLEEAHVLHSHAQRSRPWSEGELDRRHEQQCRLFAFLRVARAVRSYAVTQALVKPWAAFEARVPLCGSLRGFIRLHQAYLDLILERCFLLPRSRQTLAYLLDALQAGIAFAQRYGEYVLQLGNIRRRTGGASWTNSSPAASGGGGGRREGAEHEKTEDTTNVSGSREERAGPKAGGDSDGQNSEEDEEACRESLMRLDGLWEHLGSSLGFVIPLLRELVRSRSGVHVNELLCDLDFNHYFERQRRGAAPK